MEQIHVEKAISEAVAAFQRQDFAGALSQLQILEVPGLRIQGANYLRAVCHLSLEQYYMVAPLLALELQEFPGNADAVQLDAQIKQLAAMNSSLAVVANRPRKVLLCGICPGDTGTGRFLSSLIPVAKAAGYEIIHPQDIGFNAGEKICIGQLQACEILVLHSQNIGWDLVKSLHTAGNTLSFYVLDNSFFCINSFNHRPSKLGECFDCLGNLAGCAQECTPRPFPYEKQKNIGFLEWLKQHSQNFRFYCQSDPQRDLVLKHFGPSTRAKTVGMVPSDLLSEPGMTPESRFDMVFHGEALAAKGLHYVLQLASFLPEYSILVPCSEEEIRTSKYDGAIAPNVTLRALRWTSGLRDAVAACRLVLCPSQWSAAVEGALLKSFKVNGNVAVLKTTDGFSKVIPDDVALQLPDNTAQAAEMIRVFLKNLTCNRERARVWLDQYVASVSIESIFHGS